MKEIRKIPLNTIFKIKNNYWMIIKETPQNYFNGTYYFSVVKCNKNGKAFKQQTGYFAEFLYKSIDAGEGNTLEKEDITLIRLGGEKEKVKYTHLERGIVKRRITYLIDRIAHDTHELELLEKKLKEMK